MASFEKIIHDFIGTENVGFYLIHLERATERLPYMREFNKKLNMVLPIFPAADGVELVKQGHPVRCITNPTKLNRTPGDIGCTVSHINICKDALAHNYDYIVIFEDDCEFVNTLEELDIKLQAMRKLNVSWDLFLLDCFVIAGYGSYLLGENSPFAVINKFYLTHACILNQKFMKELISTYDVYYANNTTFAIDGIYSNVIQEKKGFACGIAKRSSFFKQADGIYSYILERQKN